MHPGVHRQQNPRRDPTPSAPDKLKAATGRVHGHLIIEAQAARQPFAQEVHDGIGARPTGPQLNGHWRGRTEVEVARVGDGDVIAASVERKSAGHLPGRAGRRISVQGPIVAADIVTRIAVAGPPTHDARGYQLAFGGAHQQHRPRTRYGAKVVHHGDRVGARLGYLRVCDEQIGRHRPGDRDIPVEPLVTQGSPLSHNVESHVVALGHALTGRLRGDHRRNPAPPAGSRLVNAGNFGCSERPVVEPHLIHQPPIEGGVVRPVTKVEIPGSQQIETPDGLGGCLTSVIIQLHNPGGLVIGQSHMLEVGRVDQVHRRGHHVIIPSVIVHDGGQRPHSRGRKFELNPQIPTAIAPARQRKRGGHITRFNPGFNRESAPLADVGGGGSRHTQRTCPAVETETLAHFSRNEGHSTAQDGVVPAENIASVALSLPPAHQTAGGRDTPGIHRQPPVGTAAEHEPSSVADLDRILAGIAHLHVVEGINRSGGCGNVRSVEPPLVAQRARPHRLDGQGDIVAHHVGLVRWLVNNVGNRAQAPNALSCAAGIIDRLDGLGGQRLVVNCGFVDQTIEEPGVARVMADLQGVRGGNDLPCNHGWRTDARSVEVKGYFASVKHPGDMAPLVQRQRGGRADHPG